MHVQVSHHEHHTNFLFVGPETKTAFFKKPEPEVWEKVSMCRDPRTGEIEDGAQVAQHVESPISWLQLLTWSITGLLFGLIGGATGRYVVRKRRQMLDAE